VGRVRIAVASLAFAAACAVATPAEARDSQVELGGVFDVFGTYMRAAPSMVLSSSDTSRPLHGRLPSVGHLTLAGAAGEMTLAVDSRLIFPIAGLGISAAVGGGPRVLSSVDGSIVEQRAWTTYMGDLLLPGIGLRFKEHRWMFSGVVRTGISFAGMSGSVASGGDTSPVTASAMSMLLRVQLEGCRRLDPVERICFEVSPSIYQYGFGNAVTAGLRWEFGP
jgi:hypothetical protein